MTVQSCKLATPFALHTPRNVPLPMRSKVKAELEHIRSMGGGVISKVDKPTPWCANMVAVPKSDESVRICVDLYTYVHMCGSFYLSTYKRKQGHRQQRLVECYMDSSTHVCGSFYLSI